MKLEQREVAQEGEQFRRKAEGFSVLTPAAFLHDLTLEAHGATQRVWMQAMYINPGTVAEDVVGVLKDAAQRKLNTRFHTDWFGLMTSDGSPNYFSPIPFMSRKKKAEQQEKTKLFADLQQNNVIVSLTNPPSLVEKALPYKGRNHMKMTIIDDITYIGGVNFADQDFTYTDFMVKITDPQIANAVGKQFMRTEEGKRSEDIIVLVNDETTLLVDGGKPHHSVILEQAVELANKATKSIYHVSQFPPDGRFLQALSTANSQRIRVGVVIPRKNTFSPVFASIHTLNKVTQGINHDRIPLTFHPSMIHAKLTIIDEEVVLFGSHNLTEKGITLGTGEIAVQSTNPTLVRNLLDFYSSLNDDLPVTGQ